jgi:hypothetical protein
LIPLTPLLPRHYTVPPKKLTFSVLFVLIVKISAILFYNLVTGRSRLKNNLPHMTAKLLLLNPSHLLYQAFSDVNVKLVLDLLPYKS